MNQVDRNIAAEPELRRGILGHLGEAAAAMEPEKVSSRVAWQAKLCILDTIGCMVAGAEEADTKTLLRAEELAGLTGKSRVVGTAARFPEELAARVNAYAGDIYELNDLIGGHASIATVSAAIAAGENRGVDGRRFLWACIAGIETTTRVHFAYYADMKPYTSVGIAPPGIVNSIGSAAAGAIVKGLPIEQLQNAMAIGAALSGWCPAEVIFGQGGTVKPMMHGSWPASVGLLASRYAEGGMTGPLRILESDIGVYSTLATGYKRNHLLSPDFWHLDEPRRKLHACCGYIHSAVDLMGQLHDRLGGEAILNAREIRVSVPAYIMPAVVKSGPPTTPNNARFHLAYCAAQAAMGEDVITPSHSLRMDKYMTQDVGRVMEKFRIAEQPSFKHYSECAIDIVLEEGAEVHIEGNAPRGAPDNPLGEEGVRRKFAMLVGDKLSGSDREAYCDRVMAIDKDKSIDWLLAPFVS
ncbi:MmgE/PrpD family 2-methylcitrate dehydratase protein (plasmid) [Rhizobium gallicum]|uniref:MmgE/PrpD family 2-methylcitrate dehydratase protein n=1 Tax=Rhizobium gallicum TaxID=56730 RepID=A0A1L5NS77_9HYPH|nr:MmgE/PrpD family protein [Rhizobium gallicum]APO70728.1 MmgE/PrpD family 2-methylcitrate dehydratase protein [Rhizobium gallicum]